MESSSTASKLVNFFTKKGFRSNLNRTKSSTKLDRKRSLSSVSERDTGSLVGSLKRTMSLGRLARRRNRANPSSAEDDPHTSLISSRLRAARSHESLLSNPSAMQAVDVTGRDVQVKAVHHTLVSRDHCFHITTPQGSKFVSCSTAEERDHWLSSLRRTKQPNQENVRRSDSSLQLWIVEAKNVPPKKRYFCEILLDHKPYACTSSKLMSEMLFWGEHFEFKDLPDIETITINVFKESDKKKKKEKSVLACHVILPVADISNKQYVEKWFQAACGSVSKSGKDSRGESPMIRLKVRHQTVTILPKHFYQDLSKYLTTDYKEMCEELENHLSLREKEEFATTLIHAMHKLGKAQGFLCDIVMSEISCLDNEHLTFRGNSIATKAMEAYMKLVGERYLHDTLGDFIRGLVDSEEDYEVDPAKVSNSMLLNHQTNLQLLAAKVWDKIINSNRYFPNELREVFSRFREHCRDQGKEDFSDNLISASIFLRFLCPAILSPSLFSITQEYPHDRAARNLTLVAKTIQTLANFTKFGGKEEFMTFMNGFIEKEAVRMKSFLRKISSEQRGNQFLQYGGFIDLERELALLHTFLFDFVHKSPQPTQRKLTGLVTILTAISQALDDPSVSQQQPKRKSQLLYDNMPPTSTSQSDDVHTSSSSTASTTATSAYTSSAHTSPHVTVHTVGANGVHSSVHGGVHGSSSASYPITSPTEALREMLRNCGEAEEDLHSFAARAERGIRRQKDTSHNNSPENMSLEHSGTPRNLDKSEALSEEFSALYSSLSVNSSVNVSKCATGGGGQREVGDVSASSSSCINHDSVNETWSQMVSAADDSMYGDYIDLIPFMDDDAPNSSSDLDSATNDSSQASISHLSAVASSGYQSFGYSHSCSPVESSQHPEMTREVVKSPIIHYPPHPLSFSNPLYRHQQQSHHTRRQTHQLRNTAGSCVAQKNECNQRLTSVSELTASPCVKPKCESSQSSQLPVDPLRKLSQLSSSSGSNESLSGHPHRSATLGRMVGGRREGGAQFTVGSRDSSPAQAHSSPRIHVSDPHSPPQVPPRPQRLLGKWREGDTGPPPAIPPRPDRTNSYCDSMDQRHLGMRPYHLSHSMDFGCLQRQHAEHLRRTATDSVIKTSTPVHMHTASTGSPRFSRENSFSSVHSSQSQMSLSGRRPSPQSAVHMGISSVQRKLQEQERTKQEYENEVHILRQQLVEAQVRLQSAEMRLMDHEVDTHQLMEEWQSRLAESEQRIRQQQAEKDGQMKSIIERLVTIEDELRTEQADMQKVVHEKQQVIEIQEQRLRTLDTANAKLFKALAELQEHASTTVSNTTAEDSNNNNNENSSRVESRTPRSNTSSHNGIMGPIKSKLTTPDLAGFKSSAC